MKVQAVILLLLVPWLVHAQQAYYGTYLSKLDLAGSDTSTDLQSIPLHAGDVITPESVRSSIQALYNTGHYSYVEVDAQATGEETSLTFRVRPNYYFSTIRLKPENLIDRPVSGFFLCVIKRFLAKTRAFKPPVRRLEATRTFPNDSSEGPFAVRDC